MLRSGSCSASSHSFQVLSCAKAVPMAADKTASTIAEAISSFTLLSFLGLANLRYRVSSHPLWSRHGLLVAALLSRFASGAGLVTLRQTFVRGCQNCVACPQITDPRGWRAALVAGHSARAGARRAQA